jgi:CHAT domain-containing protein/Flp pilus assembly protein TadD
LALADKSFRDSEKHDPLWNYRFRVLEAEILISRNMYQKSLDLLEVTPPPADSEVSVRRKMIQGLDLARLDRLEEARMRLEEAAEIADAMAPQLSGEAALDLGVLALFHTHQNALAGPYLHKALPLARQYKQPYIEAEILGSLGTFYRNLEHYDEAIDWLNQSLRLAESLHAPGLQMAALGNLGLTYINLGDIEKAIPLLEEAERHAAARGLKVSGAALLVNIGNIYLTQRSYAKAGDYFSRALVIYKEVKSEQDMAICENNLALASLGMGDLDEAERHSERALTIKRRSNDHPSELESLLTSARIAAARRDFAKAEPLLQQIVQENAKQALSWEAEGELADLYMAQNQIERAEPQFQRVLSTLDAVLKTLKHEEDRLAFSASASEFRGNYIRFLVARHNPTKALQVAELSRARTLADGLSAQRQAARPADVRTVSIADTQSFLKQSGQIVLAYWLTREQSFLWAITPTQCKLFTLPPQQQITQKVEAYRKVLLGPPRKGDREELGQDLYNTLIRPAEKLVPSGSRVIVIPYGSLNQLNFETLWVSGPLPHYWIEDVELENASSLSLLTHTGSQHSDHSKKLLLIGNPLQASPEYPRLRHADEEVNKVAQHFSPGLETIVKGGDAVPSAYKTSHPEQFSFIHFATHGTASETSPLESAIILSSEGEKNSYKLYAREILESPLKTELVTISACSGAGRRAYSAEGLVGLAWGFLRAGAHHVIAGLWDVDDAAEPELMDHFYSELGKNKNPAAALRLAKLAMLHSDSVYRNPYYWASLQLYTGS